MEKKLQQLWQKSLFTFILIFLFSSLSYGQYSYTSIGTVYSQNFDALGTGNTSVSGGNLNNRSTQLNGWYIANGTSAATALAPNNGSTNSGAVYNFGVTSGSDRSLGSIYSGSFSPRFGFYFTNNTGVTITSLKINYTGKTWRVGSANRSDKLIFQYSTNASTLWGGSWTDFNTLDYQNVSQASTNSGSILQSSNISGLITGISVANGSRIFIRWDDMDATGADDGMAIDDFSMIANPPVNTITTGTIASNTFCITSASGSNVSVPFTSSGDFSGNTYTAQLSNASGSFANPVNIGTLVSSANGSLSISAIIPADTPTGNLYKIRVISDGPPVTGTDNGANLVINLAKNSIAPAAAQNLPEGVNGNLLTVTEQSASNARVWKYATASGGSYSNFSPTQTGTTYTPNFPAAGTYYVVCESTFACGSAVSNEVVVNVAKPAVNISGTLSAFTYPQGQGPSASQSVSVSGNNLAGNVTVSVPSDYWEISTNAAFNAPVSPNTYSSISLNNNASNAVPATTIYIRLKAGLPQGHYSLSSTDDLLVASLNAITKTADLNGEVTEPSAELVVRGIFTNGATSYIISNGNSTPSTLNNTEFASQNIGTSQSKQFRLQNIGGLALTVSSISVDNQNDFLVTASAPYTIASGTYQDFTVTFRPLSAGDRTAMLSIASSDLTDPVYTFALLGVGRNPEIGVSGNGVNISSGSTSVSAANNTLIGNANVNTANPSTVSKVFVVSNSGNADLMLSSVSLSGTDASQFSISPSSSTIASGATGNIVVTFGPTSAGIKNAVVSITNNDATDNENPFTFAVQGNAVDFVACAAGALGPLSVIAAQDFEPVPASPVWTFTNSGGNIAGGTAFAVVGGSNQTVNKFLDTQSFQVAGGSGVINLNINTSGYKDIELAFRLGSFSGSTGNGADATDYVKVSVSTDGINYVDELSVKGSAANMRWSYGATGIASKTLNNTLTEFPSQTGDSGISTVRLAGLPSVSNLTIKISALNNDNNEIWGIDNVTLSAKQVVGVSEKTWNGSVWSGDGLPPTSSQKAIINGDLTLPYVIGNTTYSQLEACECEINSGKSLRIGVTDSSTQTTTSVNVVIQGKIVNNGSVILASDSNLTQRDPFAENAFQANSMTVKRMARLPKMGYNFWSAPVAGQNLYAFSNGGQSGGTPKNRFFVYDESADLFKNTGAFLLNDLSVFESGKGYAIRGMDDFGATMPVLSHEFSFSGVPNNGNISFVNLKHTDEEHGYNLVGNPYPSNLDFDALYTQNSGRIYATAYFWTNNDLTVTQQQGSGYEGNNYAVYNLTGGNPATQIDGDPDQPASSAATPTHIVKVGQAFIVKAKPGSHNQPLNFTNEMRTDNNGIFFNNRQQSGGDKYWLKLTSPAHITNTLLLGYLPQATNGYEMDFDSELMVVGSDSFYSVLGVRKLAIQGRAAFDPEDEVALGAVFSQDGMHTISMSDPRGVFGNGQAVILRDNLLNKSTDLSQSGYTFYAAKGTDATRFRIVYKPEEVLSANETKSDEVVTYRDGDFQILRSKKPLGNVAIFDASGRIMETFDTGENALRIDISSWSSGVYWIRISDGNSVKTVKLIR